MGSINLKDVSKSFGETQVIPPLNLDNIDFVGLYRNEVLRRQAEQAGQKADA